MSLSKTSLSYQAKLGLLVFICLMLTNLSAQRWQTFTNTNHVTDVVVTQDNRIFSATWGGLVEYQRHMYGKTLTPYDEYKRTLTSIDGLVSNDLRTLAYEASTGDIWVGSANDGVTILKPSGMQTLNASSGLPSNKVRRIISHQSYIFVATDAGISQFYYLPGVFFPLLLHQYNETNTQGGLLSNNVLDIAISDNGYLFCATNFGVSFVHTDSLDFDIAWRKWNHNSSPIPYSPVLSISVNADFVVMNTLTSVHKHAANPFIGNWQNWSTGIGGLRDSVYTVALTPANGIMLSYGYWDEDKMTLMFKTNNPWGYIDAAGNFLGVDEVPPELDGINYLRLPSESVYRYVVNNVGMFFCTWGEGIFVYSEYDEFDDKYLSQNMIENNCIGFQTISEIVTDSNNKIWFGSGWLGGTMTKKGTRGVSQWAQSIWHTYKVGSSPLTSNNIKNLAVDSNNKKWFGSWDSSFEPYKWRPGVNVFDDAANDWQWYTRDGIRYWYETGWSAALPDSPKLINNTIAEIAIDKAGNIHVSSSGGGVTVFDNEYNHLGTYQMPASLSIIQSVSLIYHNGTRYFFGLNGDNRLVIWNSNSIPNNIEDHWIYQYPPELNDCFVYGMVTITNPFSEEENWIATSRGLFMWDTVNWFRYDTDIKRKKFINGTWVNETLYYVDEERLFGSIRTTPTAIFLDPFNRIWIGSLENGFTMYNPDSERFTNYFMANSPLLSNYITCFGYDPISGNLLIGTPDGLNTLEIGIQFKTETKLRTVKAFPNPFIPDRDSRVRIVNLPSESMPIGKNICRIYNSAGELVIELKENYYARFDWNGLNKDNKKCSSGIYYYVVTDSKGETQRGKIALIRNQ